MAEKCLMIKVRDLTQFVRPRNYRLNYKLYEVILKMCENVLLLRVYCW